MGSGGKWKRSMRLSKGWGKNPKSVCGGTSRLKLQLGERRLLGRDRDPYSNVLAVFKECCCVVRGFVSCVLSAWNRCLLTALRKLT